MGKDFCIDVLNPEDPSGPKISATMPHRYFSHLYKYHPVQYENLRAAKVVLEAPSRIFNGVRAFNEGGWCFTGRPENWTIAERITAPFPDKLVFAVYLNQGFLVYECRAEPAAEDDPLSPKGWQDRYSALVWKRTS